MKFCMYILLNYVYAYTYMHVRVASIFFLHFSKVLLSAFLEGFKCAAVVPTTRLVGTDCSKAFYSQTILIKIVSGMWH